MTQKQIDKLSIWERATASTPLFFRKLRNIGLVIAAISAALLASPVVLPPVIITIAGYLGVAASVVSAVSQITVEE